MFSDDGPQRRKRVVISIAQKLEVCELVEKKVPTREIVERFGIGRSTVASIVKNKAKLEAFKRTREERGMGLEVGNSKVIRKGNYERLDMALYVWFCERRKMGARVIGTMIMQKASEFHKTLYPGDNSFAASQGFLARFCKRFDIKRFSSEGGKKVDSLDCVRSITHKKKARKTNKSTTARTHTARKNNYDDDFVPSGLHSPSTSTTFLLSQLSTMEDNEEDITPTPPASLYCSSTSGSPLLELIESELIANRLNMVVNITTFLGHRGCVQLLGTCKMVWHILNSKHEAWKQIALRELSLIESNSSTNAKFAGSNDLINWRNVSGLVHSENLFSMQKEIINKKSKEIGLRRLKREVGGPSLLGNNGTPYSLSHGATNEIKAVVKQLMGLCRKGCTRLSGQILELLNDVVAVQSEIPVECHGTIAHDPELLLLGTGEMLELPLSPQTLRRLINQGHCTQAPLGGGTETVIDPEIRKCWRMEIGKDVLITNPAFMEKSSEGNPDSPLSTIKACLCPHLYNQGFEVSAQPYQLLIYEECGMSLPHCDTFCRVGHFGSCIVSLPVKDSCDGGELVLDHKPITTVDNEPHGSAGAIHVEHTAPLNGEQAKWCAFFSDVVHEVRPVTRGYKVSLTYHLWHPIKKEGQMIHDQVAKRKPGHALSPSLGIRALGRVIERWMESNFIDVQFVLALNHKYSHGFSSESDLRGRDRVIVQCLSEAVKDTNMQMRVEILNIEKFASVKKSENFDRVRIGILKRCDESLCPADSQEPEEHAKIIWINRRQFMALDHEMREFEYDAGNEGHQQDFTYEHACVILKYNDQKRRTKRRRVV